MLRKKGRTIGSFSVFNIQKILVNLIEDSFRANKIKILLCILFCFSFSSLAFSNDCYRLFDKGTSQYRTDELLGRISNPNKWLKNLAHTDMINTPVRSIDNIEPFNQGVTVLERNAEGQAIKIRIVIAAKSNLDLYLLGDHNSWLGYKNISEQSLAPHRMYEYRNPNYLVDSSYYSVEITNPNGLNGFNYMIQIGKEALNWSLDPNANYFTPYSLDEKKDVRSIFVDLEYMSKGYNPTIINMDELLKTPLLSTEVSMLGLVKNYPGFKEHIANGGSILSFATRKEIIHELKSRGINLLHILPVTQSDDATFLKATDPEDASAGWSFCYLVHGQKAINSAYGTPMEFKKFVSELAKEGIAVMMDMVFHFPINLNANERNIRDRNMEKLGIYGNVFTKWGTKYYDFTNPYVVEYLKETALSWAKEYGIRFIRLDAGDEFLQEPGGEAFLKNFTQTLHQYGIFVLIEKFYGDEKTVSTTSQGGLGADVRYSPKFWSWVNKYLTRITDDLDLFSLRDILNSQKQELFQAYFTTSHDKAAPDHNESGEAVRNFFPTILKQATPYHIRGKIIAFESLGMSIGSYYVSMLQNRFLQQGAFSGEGLIQWKNKDNKDIDLFLSKFARYIQDPRNRDAFSYATLHPFVEHFIDNKDKIIGIYRSNFNPDPTKFKDYYILINLGDRLSYSDSSNKYKFGVHFPGRYKIAISSDDHWFHGNGLLEQQVSGRILSTAKDEVYGNDYSLSLPFIPPYSVTVLERVSD